MVISLEVLKSPLAEILVLVIWLTAPIVDRKVP
jgi:hypothetical protein